MRRRTWVRLLRRTAVLLPLMLGWFPPVQAVAQTTSPPSLPSTSLPPALPPGMAIGRAGASDVGPIPPPAPGGGPLSLLPAAGVGIPGAFSERIRDTVPFSSLFLPSPLPEDRFSAVGSQTLGRPRPGSFFNPGASGPGISREGTEIFLDGALDPRTGWPFVLLDHFKPRPDRLEKLWIVSTRDCPQHLGHSVWPDLKLKQFDEEGRMVEQPVERLLEKASGRPVIILIQGNLTTSDMALGGLLWTHAWLTYHRALPEDAIVIAFDWPSQRVYRFDVLDVDEKGRRAIVAGFHLAQFLQALPEGSRVALIGHSFGTRVALSALHLLGGGGLSGSWKGKSVRLPAPGTAAAVRGVMIAGAVDHNWLEPGEKLDHTFYACESLLNLYNRRDEALIAYPLLRRSGHLQALGRVGLTEREIKKLGPGVHRYQEHDVHEILGLEHTLLDAMANPTIARWMAPFLWAPDPGPPANSTATRPISGMDYSSAILRRLLRP